DGWRNGVEWKVARIDNVDTIRVREPQSSIRGPGHKRRVRAKQRSSPDSIEIIKGRSFDCRLRVVADVRGGAPRVPLLTQYAHQTARHVHPQSPLIVFDRPVNGVAWKTVFRPQRGNSPVSQPAESALRRDPKCAFVVQPQVGDSSHTQTIG